MNKARRKEIYMLIARLQTVKCKAQQDNTIDEIHSDLEEISCDVDIIRDDEECYMENMPENLQGSVRYETAEEACDNLEEAIDCIDSAVQDDDHTYIIDCVDKAIEYLEDAAR